MQVVKSLKNGKNEFSKYLWLIIVLSTSLRINTDKRFTIFMTVIMYTIFCLEYIVPNFKNSRH